MKKALILSIILLAAGVFVTPSITHAGPIIRSGEELSIDATQVLQGDFYGLSPTITLSGAAENDVYLGGGTITVNAPVAEDLVVVGGTVQIHGDVADDVRVLGGEVVIGKSVKGDVAVFGGKLTVLSTASVEGDILFFGGELVVEGPVSGSIHGRSDSIRINADIGGDVLVIAHTDFTLGDKAQVAGDVIYTSAIQLGRAQNAVVQGEIQKRELEVVTSQSGLQMYMFLGLTLLFTACSVFFLARSRVQQLMRVSRERLGIHGLIGLGIFFVVPFISTVFIVSVVGSLFGVVLLALYVTLLLLALVLSSVLLGYYIQSYFFKRDEISLSTVIIGVFAFCIVAVIPYVGGLGVFACITVLLGSIGTSLYNATR
jgi:hypothetical protein